MLTEKKSLPNSRIKLTLTATADQYRHAFDHELEDMKKDVKVPGFRPGQAPAAKALETIGRTRVEAAAIDHMVSHVYGDALTEADINPITGPHIDVESYKIPESGTPDDEVVMTLTVEVDVLPKPEIKGYKDIKVKKPSEAKIEAEEVEKVIDYLRKQRAELKEAKPEAVLAMEMWVEIGYTGSVGGVSREDMKNEHHPLIMGEGQLIPGFEEAIVGMKKGEEKTISLTFPKDYHASELSGKKAEFKVKVHEIKEVNLPGKDKAFAANFGHDSYAKLEEAIKQNIHEEKQVESRQKLEEEILEKLLGLHKFEIPASLVDQEMERMFDDAKKRLDQMGFNWDNYLGQVKKTTEEVREEMRPQAEKNVRTGLLLGRIIEEEKIVDQENAGRLAIDRLVEIATK